MYHDVILGCSFLKGPKIKAYYYLQNELYLQIRDIFFSSLMYI